MPQPEAKSAIKKETKRPATEAGPLSQVLAYLLCGLGGAVVGAIVYFLISVLETVSEPGEMWAQEFTLGTLMFFLACVGVGVLGGLLTAWRFWPRSRS